MRRRVGIVDYGTGNIASVAAALQRVGAHASVVHAPAELTGVECLVLPGVGHFERAVKRLREAGLAKPLNEITTKGTLPVLGICLGMQLLGAASEEAEGARGLGVLPLHTHRIRPADPRTVKVPHMGWNNLCGVQGSPRLLQGVDVEEAVFYFANAYAVHADDALPHHASYEHGGTHLAVVERERVFGVQFHPEKSRGAGLQVLRNFLAA
jgi:glutamine amidotransferase